MNLFYLCTIEARRWITNQFEFVSTGVYKVSTAEVNFLEVYFDDYPGTKSLVELDGSEDEFTYYFNPDINELQIRIDAYRLSINTNIVINHIIAFTDDKDMYWHIDPDDTETRKILYEGRMKGKPKFSQSQQNNLVGILSTSFTSVAFSNDDWSLNRFGLVDSFADARIKIWEGKEIPENLTKFFYGFTSRITIGSDFVVMVNDVFKKLDNILYSDEDYTHSIARGLGGTQPEISEEPITLLRGRNTGFKTRTQLLAGTDFNNVLVPESMPRAICTSYVPGGSTSQNRVWTCGLIDDAVGAVEPYTVVSTFDFTIGILVLTAVTLSSGSEQFTVGDTFAYQSGGSSRIPFLSGNPNEIVVEKTIPGPVPGETVNLHKISALMLVADGKEFPLFYGQHYSVNTIVPGDPLKITLFNNIEAAISLGRNLNPATDYIYYKARNVSGQIEMKHGQQIQKILLTEYDADELNLDSFDDADIALDLNLNYQVPAQNGGFVSKREMLEQLLASSFGYLYIDNNFKICYGNYSLNGSGDDTDTITDIEIEVGTMEHEIDFEDVQFGVKFLNPDFGVDVTITNNKAKSLHRKNQIFEVPSLVDNFCLTILDLIPNHYKKIASFVTEPRIKSGFTSLDYRANIGEKKIIDAIKGLRYVNATVTTTVNSPIRQEIGLINMTETNGNLYVSVNGSSEELI